MGGWTLDPASRVTLHLFLAQLALSMALAALLPVPFATGLGANLGMTALLQAGAWAHAAPGPGAASLCEIDGIAWLLAAACLALSFA